MESKLEKLSWKDGKFFNSLGKEVKPILVYPPIIDNGVEPDEYRIKKLVNHFEKKEFNSYSIKEISLNENDSFKDYLYLIAILKI